MSYSLDFKKKVINFVKNGGMITKAAHTFGIRRASIYRCLSRPTLSATKVKSRQRKLDWEELEKDVKQNPESRVVRQS
jgi:transposase-like protein